MEPQKDDLGLFQIEPETYGPNYRDNLFEQYKMYVEMADKISERRATANNFFLTANTLLISVFGIIVGKDIAFSTESMEICFPLFAISGLAFSIAWFYIVKSYSQLNSAKFKVIHKIEEKLPLALYKSEWTVLGEGHNPRLYRPFTAIERYAPLTFAILYSFILLVSFWYFHGQIFCIYLPIL